MAGKRRRISVEIGVGVAPWWSFFLNYERGGAVGWLRGLRLAMARPCDVVGGLFEPAATSSACHNDNQQHFGP